MKTIARLPWQNNATISILWARLPKRKFGSYWAIDCHVARVHLGRLLVVRIRRTADHAERLGLPVF